MSAGVSAPMPETLSADHILYSRGVKQDLGAFVVAIAFDRGGSIAGFALGDGTLRLARRGEAEWRRVEVHDGATLSLAADAVPGGFVSGGDDGRFARIGSDGAVETVASFGLKWVERTASFVDASRCLPPDFGNAYILVG